MKLPVNSSFFGKALVLLIVTASIVFSPIVEFTASAQSCPTNPGSFTNGQFNGNGQCSTSGSVGLTGTIPSPPPSQGATIATPTNGQVFTKLPITVTGICPSGLLIKLFINGVFSGAAECVNGSYSIITGLFTDQNVLTVIDYDSLNQAGPTSNAVTVTYKPPVASQSLNLTSNYAKLGADPGQIINWPLSLIGGTGPYAISVDWGEGSQNDLQSLQSAGDFNISHSYKIAGVYNILVKATDVAGDVAYLQIVGVANGPSAQSTNSSNAKSTSPKLPSAILWVLIALIIIVPPSTFWLGKRHEKQRIQSKVERGEPPF